MLWRGLGERVFAVRSVRSRSAWRSQSTTGARNLRVSQESGRITYILLVYFGILRLWQPNHQITPGTNKGIREGMAHETGLSDQHLGRGRWAPRRRYFGQGSLLS